MKIAITSSGKTWRDPIDIRFGRAKGYFVIDVETNQTSYIDNTSNMNAAQGAGTGSAQLLAEAGINELITGKVGPNAAAVLKAASIKVWGGIGYASNEEAFSRYKKGLLIHQSL
jgi:predicted Fe-Mo cluster-binding NifX family protein